MPKKNRIKPDAEPASVAPVRVQRSVGQPALDTRSPLAKARDKWLESADGKSCCDPLTLKAPADARQYLENRLVSAWLAGAAWAERQYRNRRLPNIKTEKGNARWLQRRVRRMALENKNLEQYCPISASVNKDGLVVIITSYKALIENSHFEPDGFLTNLAASLPGMMKALAKT